MVRSTMWVSTAAIGQVQLVVPRPAMYIYIAALLVLRIAVGRMATLCVALRIDPVEYP